MFRRTICLLLIFIPTMCFAELYVGAGGGPKVVQFQETAKVFQPGNTNVNNSDNKAGWGYFGSVFVGLGITFPDTGINCVNLYIAGELNGDASDVEFHLENNEYIHRAFAHTKYTMPYNFGFSLLPGFWYMNDTLFYGRIGFVYSNIKVVTTDTSLQNINKSTHGIRIGAGIRRTIWDHVSFRLEFSQATFDNTLMTTLDTHSNTLKKTILAPTTTEVMLGLIYEFC